MGTGKEANKLKDLAKVLERYEATDAERDYMDEVSLYRSVIAAVGAGEALPPTMHFDRIGMEEGDYNALSPVEQEFLKVLVQASRNRGEKPELLEDNVESISAAADGKAAARTFFSGYGLVNEVSYVAETILRSGWRFDDVTVLCPDEAYMAAVAEQFQEWGIPAACDGITIRHSSTVEILERFYKYVSEGYDRDLFVKLLHTSGITVPTEDGEKIDRNERETRLLNEIKAICLDFPKVAQTGAGGVIENAAGTAIATGVVTATEAGDTAENAAGTATGAATEATTESAAGTATRGATDTEVEICKVASGLKDFLLRYTYVKKSPIQRTAYGAILSMLSGYEKVSGYRMPYARAVKWFFEQAASLTSMVEFVREKGECAKVQVRSLASLRFINTDVVFVLGMTAGSFMTTEYDSPVLSDGDREALQIKELKGEHAASILRRFQYALELHNTEGHEQFFGYNGFALSNLTEQVPCLLYRVLQEQYERMGYKAEIETYDFLKRHSFGKCAQINYAEGISRTDALADQEDLIKRVGDLIKPVEDGKGRTEYELSATGLGDLVVCPMKYYLKHELRLMEPEEPIIKFGEWLTAAEKGTMLHSVLERYVNQVYLSGTQVSDAAQREKIAFELLNASLDEMRDYRPCTDYLYNREKELAQKMLQSYLGQIEEDGFVPVHTEFAIGTVSAREHHDADAVEIPISANGCAAYKIILNGVIDRIDRRDVAGDGGSFAEYRIVDYKTGKKPSVGGLPFDFIVQDYLYVKAWEKILEKEKQQGKVTSAVYEYLYVPAEKGHERLQRKSEDWDKVEAYIAQILEKIKDDGYISYYDLWEPAGEDMMKAVKGSAAVKYCPYAGFCMMADRENCGKGDVRK